MYGLGNEKRRKDFGIKTKRIEWLKAAGESGQKLLLQYLTTHKIPKLPNSQCRCCERPLTWGDGTYNFDHKNNDSSNNGQTNCYLVCRICHGKHTKTKVVKERDFFGQVVGHKIQKLKTGYKKPAKKPAKKKAKKTDNIPWILR